MKQNSKRPAAQPVDTIPVREAAAELIRGAGPITHDQRRAWFGALAKDCDQTATVPDRYLDEYLLTVLADRLVDVLVANNAALAFGAPGEGTIVVRRDLERAFGSSDARRALHLPEAPHASATAAEVCDALLTSVDDHGGSLGGNLREGTPVDWLGEWLVRVRTAICSNDRRRARGAVARMLHRMEEDRERHARIQQECVEHYGKAPAVLVYQVYWSDLSYQAVELAADGSTIPMARRIGFGALRGA